MTAAIVERALGAELGHHLDTERPKQGETERNRRNGASGKTLLTEQGPVPIESARSAGTSSRRSCPSTRDASSRSMTASWRSTREA